MILIDPPWVAAHGRLWSHLVSDCSFAELHAFARVVELPRRGFERDHYDVSSRRYQDMLDAGATEVSSRELVLRLIDSGLRRRRPRPDLIAAVPVRRPG